jgi:hypothetical protein
MGFIIKSGRSCVFPNKCLALDLYSVVKQLNRCPYPVVLERLERS